MHSSYDCIPKWQSATLTVTAAHRRVNEDALLNLPNYGIWAVADGMGGHRMGQTASTAIIDALTQALLPVGASDSTESLVARIAAAEGALQQVNSNLVAFGRSLSPPDIVGSTVVLLMVTDTRATIIWSGDSRLYLMRDRALHQITRDHAQIVEWVDSEFANTTPRPRQVLTQAVGSSEVFEITSIDIGLEPEDRLMLCTDGFYKAVALHEIAEYMLHPAAKLVDDIQRRFEAANATDDVTIIAVERVRPPVS